MQSTEEVFAFLKEDRAYKVELVTDSCTGEAKVIQGKIEKIYIRSEYYIQPNNDPYDSEGELTENIKYTYIFYQGGKETGELMQKKKKIFLKYKDRLGQLPICSCHIRCLSPFNLKHMHTDIHAHSITKNGPIRAGIRLP